MPPPAALLAIALALAAAAPVPAAGEPAPVAIEERVEADGSTTLTHQALIAASPEEVWQAIATPQGWMRWAVPLARWVPGEPEVLETSYEPSATLGDATTIRHLFLTAEAGRRLAFRTIKTPEGFPFGAEYLAVTSLFELEPHADGTLLRLTSTGYPDSEAGRALLAFFRQGNEETLRQLQTLFAPPDGAAPR